MARCEDFPCCGHELGCCPDYDENGKQLNVICVCGAKLPANSRYSICKGCMNRLDEEEGGYYGDDFDENVELCGDCNEEIVMCECWCEDCDKIIHSCECEHENESDLYRYWRP